MKDFLRQICKEKGIKLVYTNNKYIILSTGLQKRIPTLRVHKIFKNCPKKIANSITDYLYLQNIDICIKNINRYAKKKFGSTSYKINPPSEKFSKALKTINNTNTSLGEYDILSINQRIFFDETTSICKDGIISVPNDDVVELDITIDS